MTNRQYKDYLTVNANTIMRINKNIYNGVYDTNVTFNANLNDMNLNMNDTYAFKHTPYLFKGIHDNNTPYGYESSIPKNVYLSQQQLNDNKKRIYQKGY